MTSIKSLFVRLVSSLETIASNLKSINDSIKANTGAVVENNTTLIDAANSIIQGNNSVAELLVGGYNSVAAALNGMYQRKYDQEKARYEAELQKTQMVLDCARELMNVSPSQPQLLVENKNNDDTEGSPVEDKTPMGDMLDLAMKAKACLGHRGRPKGSKNKTKTQDVATKTGKVRAPRKVESATRKPYGDKVIAVTHADWNGEKKTYPNMRVALEELNLTTKSVSGVYSHMRTGKPFKGYTFTRE